MQVIVLRQPKRREELLRPVWWRFLYRIHIADYIGPAAMLDAVRSVQLYHALPHEIGHWVHWLREAEWNGVENGRQALEDRF